jgi:hypothetical protein
MKGERTRAACLDHAFKAIPLPVDIADAEQFPLIAEAGQWFASLPAERRAELEREWNA